MEQSGWVSFGGHTMHHPVLAYLADAPELQREVSDCRITLEQHLGHPVRTFAYPMGKPEHIGTEAPRAVQKAGYTWAVTTTYGVNRLRQDAAQASMGEGGSAAGLSTPLPAQASVGGYYGPFHLHRVVGDVKLHWLLLAADTSGLRKFFSPLFPYARRLLAAATRRRTGQHEQLLSARKQRAKVL